MTVSEIIELLRRFPQDAELDSYRLVVITKHSYGGLTHFNLNIPDKCLPDWSKPDASIS